MSVQHLSFSSSARAELNARKGDWPTICKAVGLSYWWITKFAQGRIAEAGVSKIERLHEYFAHHPRESDAPGGAAPVDAPPSPGRAAVAGGMQGMT